MPLTTTRLRLLADLLHELEQDPDAGDLADHAQAVRFGAYLLAAHRSTTYGIAQTAGVRPLNSAADQAARAWAKAAFAPSPDTLRADWTHQCASGQVA